MVYVYCLGTCLVVAVVYNIFLRFFATPIIWISIFATGIGLVALSLFLRKYYNDNYGEGSTNNEHVGNIIKISNYVLYGLTGIYFLTILCMFKNIRVSVAVLKTSAVIIIRNIRTLFIPFISFFFIVAYILGWLVGLGFLLSCADVT